MAVSPVSQIQDFYLYISGHRSYHDYVRTDFACCIYDVLKMRVIDASIGLFVIHQGKRDGFRIHLPMHGIPCEELGYSAAGNPCDDSGKAPQPDEDQPRFIHPEDIEKVKGIKQAWKEDKPVIGLGG